MTARNLTTIQRWLTEQHRTAYVLDIMIDQDLTDGMVDRAWESASNEMQWLATYLGIPSRHWETCISVSTKLIATHLSHQLFDHMDNNWCAPDDLLLLDAAALKLADEYMQHFNDDRMRTLDLTETLTDKLQRTPNDRRHT